MTTGLKIALSVLMTLQAILFIYAFFKMPAECIGWMTVMFLNAGFFYINTINIIKFTNGAKQ